MDLVQWAAFSLATLVVLIVPGPTVLVVMNCVLQHGKKSLTPAILGGCVG